MVCSTPIFNRLAYALQLPFDRYGLIPLCAAPFRQLWQQAGNVNNTSTTSDEQ